MPRVNRASGSESNNSPRSSEGIGKLGLRHLTECLLLLVERSFIRSLIVWTKMLIRLSLYDRGRGKG